MQTLKPNRELSFSEIFEYSSKIYSEHAKNIVLPYLILGIISVILNYIVRISFSVVIMGLAFSFLNYIIQMLLSMIVAGMIIKYVADVIEGYKTDLKSSLNYVKTRLADIVIASILLVIIILIGVILLIIPGIIFGIMFALTIEVVVLEGKSPIEALNRSRTLVKGRWMLTAMLIIPLSILSFIVNEIPVIGWIPAMLIHSYIAVMSTVFYYSLRAREEKSTLKTI